MNVFAHAEQIDPDKITFHDINTKLTRVKSDWDDTVNMGSTYSRQEYTLYQGALYFIKTNHGLGTELWRHDIKSGTETIVLDLQEGVEGASPKNLTVVGEQLYFSAFTSEYGRELWVYDGKSEKAQLVEDITKGQSDIGLGLSSDIFALISVANKLYFWLRAEDEKSVSLYAYDNDIKSLNKLIEVQGRFYNQTVYENKLHAFVYNSEFEGSNWFYNRLIVANEQGDSISSSEPTSFQRYLANPHVIADQSLFTVNSEGQLVSVNLDNKTETTLLSGQGNLWSPRGSACSQRYNNIESCGSFVFYNGKIYAEISVWEGQYSGSNRGVELYEYDLESDSLTLVADLNTSFDYGGFPKSSDFSKPIVIDDKLYFSGISSLGNRKLWSYSLTEETLNRETIETEKNTDSAMPFGFVNSGDYVYFFANDDIDSFQREMAIWRVNIETEVLEKVKNIEDSYDTYNMMYYEPAMVVTENKLVYFTGSELWVHQLTTGEHQKIDAQLNITSPAYRENVQMISNGQYVYIWLDGLKTLDLTDNSIIHGSAPSTQFAKVGSQIYFKYTSKNDNAASIWVEDASTNKRVQIVAVNQNDVDIDELEIEFSTNDGLYLSKQHSDLFYYYDFAENRFEVVTGLLPIVPERKSQRSVSAIVSDKVVFDIMTNKGTELIEFDHASQRLSLLEGIWQSSEYRRIYSLFSKQGKVNFIAPAKVAQAPENDRFNDSHLWRYDEDTKVSTPVIHGNKLESYYLRESLYVKGKLFSAADIIKDGVKYGRELLVTTLNVKPEVTLSSIQHRHNEQAVVSLSAQASDLDDDELTYHWQQIAGPTISLNDVNSETIDFVAPMVSSDTRIELKVLVSDGEFTVDKSIELTIVNIEQDTDAKVSPRSGGTFFYSIGLLCLFMVWLKRKPSQKSNLNNHY